MASPSPSRLVQLPLELILYIGLFLCPTSLRALRATSSDMLELLSPMAFRVFLVRLRSVGFRKRIAPLKHNDMSMAHLEALRRNSYDLLSYIKVIRVEIGDATVHQDPSYIIYELCLLQPSMDLQRLEVVFSPCSDVQIGAVYAFSAFVHQISTHTPLLPFEDFVVIDSTRPDLQMFGTKTSFHLRLTPMDLSCACIAAVPRWILYCPPHLTSFHMSRIVVDVDVMRGMYHIIPALKDIHLRDCVIDLQVQSKRPLTWGFLWHTAKQNGCQLRSVSSICCTYLGYPLGPHTPDVQLDILLQTDAELLVDLLGQVRSRER